LPSSEEILRLDVHSSGIADTKESYLRGLREGVWDYRRIARTEQTVKVNGDTALIFNRLAISITAWRLVALQSGAVPKP
jgi:hypothetical protein